MKPEFYFGNSLNLFLKGQILFCVGICAGQIASCVLCSAKRFLQHKTNLPRLAIGGDFFRSQKS